MNKPVNHISYVRSLRVSILSLSITTIKRDCLGKAAFATAITAGNTISFTKEPPAFSVKATFPNAFIYL